MKQHFDVPLDLTEQIHQAEDQNNSWNYHPYDYLKMIYPQEGSQAEEDFQAEEYPEEEEDTLVEEAHQEEDLLEVDGGPHQFKYLNHNMGN